MPPTRLLIPVQAFSFRLISFLLGVVVLAAPALAQTSNPAPNSLITQAIDETKLTVLRGNTHPLAQAEFDRGPAPADLQMQRMLLVLARSPQAESALQTLLQQQQYKASPSFHEWLTPDQFGQQFGLSDPDIQTITSWLTSQGFQVAGVSKGRGVVEFSGTAGQVQQAFHTVIHSYVINGEQHWANSTDPQIPAALAPAVIGVDSLNNFTKKATHRVVGAFNKTKRSLQTGSLNPQLYIGCGYNDTGAEIYCNALGPYDFATIYNVLPLWNASPAIDGTGETIAIVARSNINLQDVTSYETLFGLPSNPPQVILDGPDPGLVPGDETEADLDTELSGGIAKGATIDLVVSESTETTDGVDLSAEYIVDNDVAPIMSASFGSCELSMGTAGNEFYSNLWEQAAAEGISVFVSADDQGSAGCDYFQGTTPQPAENGLEVNGLASTPYNVAVGGTDFSDAFNSQLYWSSTNNTTTQETALGYIPETTWNDTCTNTIWQQIGFSSIPETNCNNSELSGAVLAIGGGGGKSSCTTPSGTTPTTCGGGYPKPVWQSAPGVPADNARDLPDVSLFSSDGFQGNFYAICEADELTGACSPYNVYGVGGTSAASPAFAALMAMVDQKTGARQGDPAFILYKLAANQSGTNCISGSSPASTCTFNDVTTGTNAMPCATGSANCTTTYAGDKYGILSGYNTTAGYDLATGLGSVNANNLVNNWNSVTFTPSTTTLTLNGGAAVNVVHGSPVNASVSVSPTSPTPTGDVSLIATQASSSLDVGTLTLSNGTASGSTNMLPGGTSYAVKAHYAGDGTYGGSDSNSVNVTVTPESSKTFVNLVILDANGNPTNFTANNWVYGSSPFILRVDVGDSTASVSPTTGISSNCSKHITNCPTGIVALSVNGVPFAGGSLPLNISGFAEDLTPTLGTYTVTANYPGDSSYGASSASTTLTVSQAPTTVQVGMPSSSIQYGNYEQINAEVVTTSQGIAPTGTISFFLDGAPLTTYGQLVYQGSPYDPQESPPLYATLGASGFVTFLTLGKHTLTGQYSGDTNYASATSAPTTITITQAEPSFYQCYANPSSVNVNQPIVLNAQLNGSDVGVAPTGTITFLDNNQPLSGTVTYSTSGANLNATMPYTPIVPGLDQITCKYPGDVNYLPATSVVAGLLTVTGPDFSLLLAGATTQTVTAGQTATFASAISVSGLDGFNGQVNLACSTTAPGATCSVNPSSLSPGTGSATISVATTATDHSPPAGFRDYNFHRLRLFVLLIFLASLAALFFSPLAKTRSLIRNATLSLLLATFLLVLGWAAGCGGNGSAAVPPPPPPNVYAVTVTGTSGALVHTSTLTLLVQSAASNSN